MFLPRRFVAFLSPLVFVFGLALPMATHAFAVSPVLIDQTQDPGSASQGVIHITNDTEQAQTYYTSVQNFVPQGEEGQQTYLPDTDRTGLVSWLALDRSTVTLKAHESQDFHWALTLPKDAEPGGHYAAIFFSTQPLQGGDSNVGVGSKTGVLFLLSVTGNVTEAASVESFRVAQTEGISTQNSAAWIDSLPAYLELRVKNSGSVHLQPQGTITITNMFGSVVDKVPANPDGSRVLPQSIRIIRSSWGPETEENAGFFNGLKAEWHGFALGRYTATLSAEYGHTHSPLSASISVWVFPWRLAVVVLLLLVVLILIIKGYNRLVVKSAMSKMKSRS